MNLLLYSAKLPTSAGRSSGSVVIRTPVVTNGTRQRGVVTATTVSRAEEQSKQVESTSPTSVQVRTYASAKQVNVLT